MTTARLIVLVQGTDSWTGTETDIGEWWSHGPFIAFLRAHGFEPYRADDPFFWSTDLNGHKGWRRWFTRLFHSKRTADHRDWQAGGRALRDHIAPLAFEGLNFIAHSHGLQVLAYAALQAKTLGRPLRLRRVVTVGSPIRLGDMAAAYLALREASEYWLHIYDNEDEIQEAGELGDGRVGVMRACPWAHLNVMVPDIEHSRILRETGPMQLWQTEGWLDLLRADAAELLPSSR